MKICFPDLDRQRLFNHGAQLNRDFGQQLSALIKCRLAVLQAAANLSLVPSDKLFDLKSEGAGHRYSVRLDRQHRLYFQAASTSRATTLETITHIIVFGVDQPSSTKVFQS